MDDFSGLKPPGSADARSHKQRMLDGDWFFGPDPELMADTDRAQALTAEDNALFPTDPDAAVAVLRRLFRHFGYSIARVPLTVEFGYNVSIGDHTIFNWGVTLADNAPITFGDNVLVGPGCFFVTAEHPLEPEERILARVRAKPITVGDRVWFGAGVIVLGGVTIGTGAVVGAGAVVTKDVPPRTVVAGSPARVLRQV